MNEFFFGGYPYLCLAIMTFGLIWRFIATPGEWNARSSELFAKRELGLGSYIFHFAIILAFFGHVLGLLTPQGLLDALGFSLKDHVAVAGFFGRIIAPAVLLGLGLLLWRRISHEPVWKTTVPMDVVVILLIMFQAVCGGFQDYLHEHFDVFDSIAPWIRGVLFFNPRPELMLNAPLYLKLHVVFGLGLMALIPYSRLVHFFSVPVTFFVRPLIVYRRRYENL